MLSGGDDFDRVPNGNGHRSWWRRRKTSQPAGGAFQRLALQLHYELSGPAQPRSVLLATPGGSSSTARTAMTLACALAREIRKPVLLIDANPGTPLTTELLGDSSRPGFMDLLKESTIGLDNAVLPTSDENVFFLPAGAKLQSMPERGRILEVLGHVTAEWNFVILAGGGVLNDSMARALGPHVGCVLLLAAENETMTDELDAAQDALTRGDSRRVGVLLTTAYDSAVQG